MTPSLQGQHPIIDSPQAMRVPLTQGYYAIIDVPDAALLGPYKWHVTGIGTTNQYAKAYNGREFVGKSRPLVWMHRVILGAQEGQYVDHINGNGLDNRRSNLRFATYSQNHAHRLRVPGSNTGYRGVYLDKRRGNYRSYLVRARRVIQLGVFTNPLAAAIARDLAVQEVYGEFAVLNFHTCILDRLVVKMPKRMQSRFLAVQAKTRAGIAEAIVSGKVPSQIVKEGK